MLSLIFMASLSIFFALILVTAEKTFKVKEDKKLEEIISILPGVNCGGCGFPSCEAYAKALREGKAKAGLCVIGGEEVNRKISEVLGVSLEEEEKKVAILRCNINEETRKRNALYHGIDTCFAANLIQGGGMACPYGCLGFGDCVKACPVDAIKMVKGSPKVDYEKCVGCGECVRACPRGLYELVPYNRPLIYVACNNTEPIRKTREVCDVGCIGCTVCEKLSNGAFEIKNNLARLRRDKEFKDINLDKAIEKCPTKVILKEE